MLRRENAQDRVDSGGLANPRPADDYQHLGVKRHRDRSFLAIGERQAGARISIASGTALTVNASAPTGSGNAPIVITSLNCRIISSSNWAPYAPCWKKLAARRSSGRGAGGHFDEPGNIERAWRWMLDRAIPLLTKMVSDNRRSGFAGRIIHLRFCRVTNH